MTVYDQMEKLLSESDTRPSWADEILFELREIKHILKENRHPRHKNNRDYFRFVDRLRQEMRADIANDIYPEILYKGRTLGINLKGFIYDKTTAEDLPAHEAFEVYRFLYDNREQLEEYLVRPTRKD